MVEKLKNNYDKDEEKEFSFSFLENFPHFTIEEVLVLNGGAHLVNHLFDHRHDQNSNLNSQAKKLQSSYEEIVIADLIVEEIERVGENSYENLPKKVLDEGRLKAMTIIGEMFTAALDKNDWDWR